MTHIKMTKAIIDKIPFTLAGQNIYRDTELKGFGLRVGKDKKSYFIEKRVNNKSRRKIIGDVKHFSVDDARKRAMKYLGMMSDGIDLTEEEKKKKAAEIMLEEAYEEYKKIRKLRPSTVTNSNYTFNQVFGPWKKKLLSEISRDGVQKKHLEVSKQSGPVHANNAMRLLRTIYNFAANKYVNSDGESHIKGNPVNVLSATKAWNKETRRQTIIDDVDLPAWASAVNDLQDKTYSSETMTDYFMFVLFTGVRKSEAAKLRWSDVCLKGRKVTFRETKNGKDHTLPLSSFLLDMLIRRKAGASSVYVFPGNGKTGHLVEPKNAVSAVVRIGGVKFTTHDLRRNFTTAANQLLPYYTAKRLLNHSMTNSDVTDGYVVVSFERMREAMEKITQHFLSKIHSGLNTTPANTGVF